MQNAVTSNVNVNVSTNGVNSFKNILHYIANILINLILAILIAIISLILISVVDNKINEAKGNNVPPLFGSYVIVSPSMVPTIKVQDAILVARVNPNQLKVGDIITFKSSDYRYLGYTVTHRIKEIYTNSDGKRTFITKGDNNSLNDSAPVLAENIYGKVVLKLPGLGFLQSFIFNNVGFILIIIIPLGCIIIYNVRRYITKRNNENDSLDEIEVLDIIDDDEIEII